MIILDLNQTMIANIMNQIGNHTNIKIEEDLVRHMILNSIRSYKQKYSNEYGELVIACDSKKYWRKEFFPYYKSNRKKAREASEIDWNELFNCLNKIRDELIQYFPYRILLVEGAEADDIIGTLVINSNKGGDGGSLDISNEKILILSGDKDFVQLQVYNNVSQIDPIRKKTIANDNPAMFLKEHIMKGDRGDGIPNFLSPDDCIHNGERQKPLTAKRLSSLMVDEAQSSFTEDMKRNWSRNSQLIDLHLIPKPIQEKVIKSFDEQQQRPRDKMFNYFIKFKLKNLMEHINEF